jgi:hypothetical protein
MPVHLPANHQCCGAATPSAALLQAAQTALVSSLGSGQCRVRDEGSLHVAVVPVFTAIGTVLDEPIDSLWETLRPLLLFLPSKCQKLLVANVVPTLLFRQFTMPCAFEKDSLDVLC